MQVTIVILLVSSILDLKVFFPALVTGLCCT